MKGIHSSGYSSYNLRGKITHRTKIHLPSQPSHNVIKNDSCQGVLAIFTLPVLSLLVQGRGKYEQKCVSNSDLLPGGRIRRECAIFKEL